ncbi:hypothetical protein FEM48_Zijuj08G0062500 [Ziziphus jujuba var. spinosa]|uniref:RNase H type-1 domain-containing protein n=1 Tax=Ziziphus jujuba var. spinosa TaxID=714518 RepID=A0A978UXG1_ZIZJJ|nr:hypothetical protein FEM48_Zijuj08G0062500 [Ziziphus jujuba var. spinosa]
MAPDIGWWKINTDGAYSDGKAGIAFVVKDSDGKILFFASKNTLCDSPYEAELQAMYRASGYANGKEILELKKRFHKFSWSLKWNARSANGVTDALAKKALYDSYAFDFCSNVVVLPSDILNLATFDCLGKSVSL